MKTKEIIFYTFKTLETLTKKQLQQIGRDNKIILGRKRSKLSMRKILLNYFSSITKESVLFIETKTWDTLTTKELQTIVKDNNIVLGKGKRDKLSMRKILFPYFSARKIKTNPFAKNQSLVFFKTETLKNMSSYPFLVVL